MNAKSAFAGVSGCRNAVLLWWGSHPFLASDDAGTFRFHVEKPSMALFAAGFNAWNQLHFGNESSDNDPEDVFTFSNVLTIDDVVRLRAGLHYTLGTKDNGPSYLYMAFLQSIISTTRCLLVGFRPLLDPVITLNSRLLNKLTVRRKSGYHSSSAGLATGIGTNLDLTDTTFVAGNGLTVVIKTYGDSPEIQNDDTEAPPRVRIVKYESYEDFEAGHRPTALAWKSPVQEVAAYEAGFLFLFEDGTVATLGDARYQECLARDISQES